LQDNQITSIESGAFSGLGNLTSLNLGLNGALTDLNLENSDFSKLTKFNVGGDTSTWLEGDFNGDGNVNDADAAILAAHWGEGGGEEPVPEPGSLALLAGIAVLGVVYLRRRKA
jgi:hypothetical protein